MEFFVPNTSYYAYSNFLNERANLTIKNKDLMCRLAYSFRSNAYILLQVFSMAALSFATLVILWLIIRSEEMRRVYKLVGTDLRLLIWSGLIVYAIGSANSFLFFTYKLATLILDLPQCSYIWSGTVCYWTQKVYASLCVRGYLILHAGLLLERFCIVFFENFTFWQGFLGSAIMSSILIISPFSQSYATDPIYYNNSRVYCTALNTSTDKQFWRSTTYYIILNISITVGDFFLYIFNRWQMNRHHNFRLRQRAAFDLEKTFKIRQMDLSINVIYPFALVNSATYCLQMMCFLWYSSNIDSLSILGGMITYEFVNFGRIFGNFVLIAFLWWHGRQRSKKARQTKLTWLRSRETADEHFRIFQNIIQ